MRKHIFVTNRLQFPPHTIFHYWCSASLVIDMLLHPDFVTSIVYQETPPDRRAESVTASEEVKYFTAYPSLAVPADSSRDSATLKDLPTTERIAGSLTQPPPPPPVVLLSQTEGIIKTSTTASPSPDQDQEENYPRNISETGQPVMQTGNYS